jgi:very-short-patch-repair endonuclease
LENRLWAQLRQIEGFRFRRNAPFSGFILDFAEHAVGLAISLEDERGSLKRGSGHTVRDRLLSEQGYVILRLWRREAERDLPAALDRIKSVLADLSP